MLLIKTNNFHTYDVDFQTRNGDKCFNFMSIILEKATICNVQRKHIKYKTIIQAQVHINTGSIYELMGTEMKGLI